MKHQPIALFVCLALVSGPAAGLAQEGEMDKDMVEVDSSDRGADFQRGVDAVARRGDDQEYDTFQRWGALLFGERTFDPLAGDEEAQQVQEVNEGVGERAETMAEYTDAATDVVTAGAPAPHAAAEAGSRVVGAAASDAASEEPGIVGRFFRAVGEFFSNLFGSGDESSGE